MFNHPGLVNSLVAVVGKDRWEWIEANEMALSTIKSIAKGDVIVKKGICEHKGLLASLVEVVGKEGGSWKVAREYVIEIIKNITEGDAVVPRGVYEHQGEATISLLTPIHN